MGTFSSEVVAALLRKEGGALQNVPGLADFYNTFRVFVPGAPLIEDLKPEETTAIVGIRTFVPASDVDWNGLVARLNANDQFLLNCNNPYFPKWFGKTDNNPSVWVADTGDIDAPNQALINQIFYLWQRTVGAKPSDTYAQAPCGNKEVLDSIVTALKQFMPILFRPMGYDTGKNAEFRLSSTLPMLCSFGYEAFREFSEYIGNKSNCQLLCIAK